MFAPPPPFAAFRHRDGFEVAFLAAGDGGVRVDGHTCAVEDGEPFAVSFTIELDARWHTRGAHVYAASRTGRRELRLRADGAGGWEVDGASAAAFDGCLDVDLESSALTNAFPVRRLDLAVGEQADAPAAYVRALDLRVERLEQTYQRLPDGDDGRRRHRYAAPVFDFACELESDASGLALAYPRIAVRAG